MGRPQAPMYVFLLDPLGRAKLGSSVWWMVGRLHRAWQKLSSIEVTSDWGDRSSSVAEDLREVASCS